MRVSVLRSLIVAASFLLPTVVGAQIPTTRPTPEQAQILLQTRPDLVAQLRQRFATSGLSREQVRARLRAEGYPEDLLDAYLPGTTGTTPALTDDVFRAVKALGIADSADVSAMQESFVSPTLGTAQAPPTIVCVVDPYAGLRPAYDTVGQNLPPVVRAPTVPQLPGQYTMPGPILPSTPTPVQDRPRTDQTSDSARARMGQLCPPGQIPTRLDPRQGDSPFGIGRDSAERLAANRDSGFVIFGLDVFRGSTTQFEPNLAGPVDANYRLGPGDRLVLILTGDVEASYELPVTREGFVVIPQVGQLFVANLTLGELDRVLATRLARVYSGVRGNNSGTTRFSISVARLRSNQVYVVGDVRRPGSYVVSSAGTALTALYAAGGPTMNGSLRSVEIRRAGRTVDVLDVYDYLVRGDASHDVRLQTGDVVFVPVHGPRVRILGEIARPATYELRGTETLSDLLRSAGGFQADASRQRVHIERILPPAERSEPGRDRVTIDVSSAALASGAGPAIPLQDGDVVRVFPVADRVRNRIYVDGNVFQAGAQGLDRGMQLSDALRRAVLKPDTYLGEVLVSRLRPDSSRIQLRATLADSTGAVVNDLPLQEDDRISVFSITTFRPARYVSIGGAVRRSGRVLYREGMTLRDLVLLAHGLTEGAYLREAEIARLPEDRSNGRTATTLRVPLDSTYLFERAADGRYIGPPGLQVPSGSTPDVPLKPYDNVLIMRQPDWNLQRTVIIQGEVRFPGIYSLTSKSERLSDLIKRAGGLTDEAYRDGIVFNRRDNNIGRVGVELSNALRRYESADNLILRDGDNISIPAYNAVVTIRGEVNSPSTVAYIRGKGIDYYIGAAGGPTPKADEDHAYVTQPSGKLETVRAHLFLPDQMPKPRPGSVVTVPVSDGAPKRDWIPLVTGLAQIIGSTVAILVAVTR
ncbi:MAG TPA: SLBB domain-containing protein [Gemmatimonadaceae bacterium]|nr:SLBB domain-containing protein [Gemmatimonadaceae bacterium]